jgi:hypothetical protein
MYMARRDLKGCITCQGGGIQDQHVEHLLELFKPPLVWASRGELEREGEKIWSLHYGAKFILLRASVTWSCLWLSALGK